MGAGSPPGRDRGCSPGEGGETPRVQRCWLLCAVRAHAPGPESPTTAPWGAERAHHGGAGLWTKFAFVSLHVGPGVCPGRAPVPAFEVTSGAGQFPP